MYGTDTVVKSHLVLDCSNTTSRISCVPSSCHLSVIMNKYKQNKTNNFVLVSFLCGAVCYYQHIADALSHALYIVKHFYFVCLVDFCTTIIGEIMMIINALIASLSTFFINLCLP